MRFYLFLLAFTSLLSFQLRAQDTTLARFVRQNSYSFTTTSGQFSGAGWEKLQQAIGRSQFVLIGEDHGLAQIPVFTAAVARVLEPKAFVAEIDLYQAQELNRLAAQPGPPTAFQQQYPYSLSFYSWVEEYQLIQDLYARKTPVLGIDQVSFRSTGRLYALMAEKARTKPAKAFLQQRAIAYLAYDRAIQQRGTDEDPRMMTLLPAAIDSLLTLTAAEGPEVQQMARDFAASYAIYRTYSTNENLPNGLSGHQARVNMMKRNLVQALRSYQQGPTPQLPKLLFKFGANHVGRDRAIISNDFDIGNLMASLADIQDAKSLHIMVMGKQGTQRIRDTFDAAKNVGQLKPEENTFIKPFLDQTGTAWNLTDLRPARRALTNHQLRIEDPLLERIILGYDYLVIIPETTASSNY